MTIRSLFFCHDAQHNENKIVNIYLKIQKYLLIQLRPKTNILSVEPSFRYMY